MRFVFLIFLSIIICNVKGQDRGVSYLDLDSISNNTEINYLIDSVFSNFFDGNEISVKIYKRYVSIPYLFNPKIAPNKSKAEIDSFYLLFSNEILSHTYEIIDSTIIDITSNGNPMAILFITYPYEGYILAEVYVTNMFNGYRSSEIVESKRLQFLLKYNKHSEFEVIDYRVVIKGNKYRYLK